MAPYYSPTTGKHRKSTTSEQWHSFDSWLCVRVWEKSLCVSTVAFVLTAFSQRHVEMPQARARRSLAIKHFHMAAYIPLKCFPFNFLLGGIEKPLNVSYDPKTPHCNHTNKSLLDLLGMPSSQRDFLSTSFVLKTLY